MNYLEHTLSFPFVIAQCLIKWDIASWLVLFKMDAKQTNYINTAKTLSLLPAFVFLFFCLIFSSLLQLRLFHLNKRTTQIPLDFCLPKEYSVLSPKLKILNTETSNVEVVFNKIIFLGGHCCCLGKCLSKSLFIVLKPIPN